MGIEALFDKLMKFLNENKSKLINIVVVILAALALMLILFISSDEINVSKEANTIANNIEQRKYSIAIDNYETWEEQFSSSKMKRFNKSVSKKVGILLLEKGNEYVEKQITKEHYSGIINTINALDGVVVDTQEIAKQAKRVSEMYLQENISYDTAINYMNILSTLNQIDSSINALIKDLKEIHSSRDLYNLGLKDQDKKNYYEAIESYKKVLEKDSKYYKNAQNNIKKCVDEMYEFYLEEIKDLNKSGEFEKAMRYISYLKPYYKDDKTIKSLESELENNLSLYTLTSDEIISLITSRSSKEEDSLKVEAYRIMANNKSYYYTQLYEFDYLVNTLLIDPVDKNIYSYKDKDHSFESEGYVDGFFRTNEEGVVEFSTTIKKSEFIIEKVLKENSVDFKKLENVTKEQMDSKIDGSIDEILSQEGNNYYYYRVDRGWFKSKKEFVINMYTEQVFEIEDDQLKSFN